MTAVSDYFIYIHIALGTAAGLPYNQWKLIIKFSFQNFITYFAYQVSIFLLVKHLLRDW